MEPILGQGAAAAGADLIKDSDIAGFAEDVIRASMDVPVLVDFWAPWCGPCKQLTPMLEKLVKAAAGKVRLVKVNIDENQAIAQQLRIQSIPAVFAFHQGKPVDGFVGVVPESQIRSLIERLAGSAIGPSPVEQAIEQARADLETGDFAAAQENFVAVLQADAENLSALAGLARCMIGTGDLEGAREILDNVSAESAGDADIAGAKAALSLAEESAAAGTGADIADLTMRIDTNSRDFDARFELAIALNAGGQRREAADQLIEIVRLDRNWNDEGARQQLIKLFEAWGPTDPLTLEIRRLLSTVLFS